MPHSYIDRSSQNGLSQSNAGNQPQRKIDPVAQLKALNDNRVRDWGLFDDPPAQLFARDEEEEKTQAKIGDEPLQKKAVHSSTSTVTHLPSHVQAKMGSSFGTDFSGVNIHTNSDQATNMCAMAYTQGNDVHFAPGQYNPGSQKGQELIGHELTHVVQQREGRVAPTKQGKGLPVNDNPALEKEADEMGAKAAQGKMADVAGRGRGVQRQIQKEDSIAKARNGSSVLQSYEEEGVEKGVLSIPNFFNVWANSDGTIKVVIYNAEGIASEYEKSTIEAKRNWIVDNYNWNGIVGIMKYVSENDAEFTYTNPNNLTGTTDDNSLIIPDNGVLGIVRIQLQNAIESNNGEITAENVDAIISSVDGLPGSSFATIMGETSQNTLRDEGDNTNMQKADGTDIEIPDFGSDSEETLYDFMRDITLARNGLWSDEDSIVNLTGLRRELEISEAEDHQVQWNDTMAASWIETDAEGNEIKHCKHYTATTEPGNRDSNRMMAPQTITVLMGLHKGRQPAGRTWSPLIKGSDIDNNEYDFDTDNSAGMNFHPGGMGGYRGKIDVTPDKLSGFPGQYGAKTENDFSDNLLLGEAFYILSKYGTDWDKSAYDYLKTARDTAIATAENQRTEEQTNSISDYERITTILSDNSFTTARKTYLKNKIKYSSEAEEEHLDGDATTALGISTANLEDGSLEISENVHLASEGCQVIYGAKTFYDYWWNTINKAEDSGQRRWYYTLINITDPYNEIETQEGELNE